MKYIILSSLASAAFLGLVLGLTAAPAGQAAAAAAAPAAADRDQIDRWVAQLGDDDFDVREAASRELLGREEAVPALRKALKSPDVEMHKRAADLLEARERKRAAHELDRALELAKDGRIDEVVEQLVRWQGADDDKKGWEAVCRIAAKVMELADHDQGAGGPINRKDFLPPKFFRDLWAGPRAKEAAFPKPGDRGMDREGALLRAETVDTRMIGRKCIIAASRSLRLSSGPVNGCIIVCGGSVEAVDLLGSIVICDGDFEGGASNCIVIARGKVTIEGPFGNVFISAREVVVDRRSHGVGPLHDGQYGCVVRTGNVHPLDFIHFFDPAEAGVEASAVDDHDGGTVPDGVLVKGVAKGKPFAAAGLRAGDVITAVGDEKVVPSEKAADQFDSFRRSLRKALAADEAFTLSVRRSDKILELTVLPTD